MEKILNFCLRVVFGILGIIGFNILMEYINVTGMIGINAGTVLSVGTLGLPGFLLLCGVTLLA